MNNNKNPTLHVNLLPIIVIIALIIGAGYLLTEGDIKIPFLNSSNKMSIEHVQEFPREVYTSQDLDKQRVVIKSQKELDEFLLLLDPTGLTKIDENINFDREWIVAVSTETLDTDGYKMKIDKVYTEKEKDTLLVSALLTEPGDTCEVEEVKNIAVDMIRVKHTDKQIDFERFKRTEECGDIEEDATEESSAEEDSNQEDATQE